MKPVLIAVAGGSASGKTTVVKKLMERLHSDQIVLLKHDDYYRDQSGQSLEERARTNYDHPSSLDNDLLVQHLTMLLSGQPIEKPLYDFTISNRLPETEWVEPGKVIVLEGILALHDSRIRDLATLKIFVECDEDVRFIRRLLRDMNERGRSMESIINQYLSTVKPMFHEFVRPTKRYANIIIPNSDTHEIAVDVILSRLKEYLQAD